MPSLSHIAFVCPRFPEGPTVGGAETLLKQQAVHLARAGRKVSFLTTCARNHFTWENEVPPGDREIDGLRVYFFPVDEERDVRTFLRVQESISRGRTVTPDEESLWLGNSVNSQALFEHLRTQGQHYDRIVMGPYLFGLVCHAATIHPDRTLLVPCLHDEPFAYLQSIAAMFRAVRGCVFNTEAERELARRLYELDPSHTDVVGMGLDPFECDPDWVARRHGVTSPYLLYSGRREPLKGTPLLLDYFAAFRERTRQDINLVLTGTGPVSPPAGVSQFVVDLGFVSEQEKHNTMAGALAFCHPSVNESLGIVLLESWLAGTPGIVHAGSSVLRRHCEASNAGLWFRTYAEFEEECLLLLRNPDVGRAMGEAGRDYVRSQYAWQAIGTRLDRALAK